MTKVQTSTSFLGSSAEKKTQSAKLAHMMTTTRTQTIQNAFSVTKDASQIEIPRGPVQSSLNFIKLPEDGLKPYEYVGDYAASPPEGQERCNYGDDTHLVVINDIRGREHEFDIDVDGFRVVSGVESIEKEFTDEESIKKNYYPEIERLLLDNLSGAHRIVIFGHTVRRSSSDPSAKRGPIHRAHIDQTTDSAIMRVKLHVEDEAEELLKGRYRLINVWRPINGPVVASPLAYADSRSVSDEDVVAIEHRSPRRTGYTAGVRYSDQARWWYWSGMRNDERILLQCFDSVSGARAPHTAFVDPRTQEDWPGRESIEVRALVFG